MLMLFIITIITKTCFCQLEFPSFEILPLNVGDSCRLSNGNYGICTEINACPHWKKSRNFLLNICSYNLKGPILCCSNSVSEKRISEKKCDEYKKLIKIDSRVTFNDYNILSIAGGQSTNVYEFPHMAAIGFKMLDETVQWKCGGSLISEKFVMTAAHCIKFEGDPLDVIRISDHNLYASSDDSNVQERTVDEIFIHPNYSSKSSYHDIALIKLSEKITFGPKTRPVCLWTKDEIVSKHVLATGWGDTKFGGSPSEELLKVDLEIYDQIECMQYYNKGRRFRDGIIAEQLCAGDRTGEKDTCQGDSGGALQLRDKKNGDNVYYIVGVTSFGKACGIAGTPSVYTRVSKYIDWIEKIVWPN